MVTQAKAVQVQPKKLIPALRIGRPPKFNSPEELQDRINAYLDQEPVPNIMGLSVFCGVDRGIWSDWEVNENVFSPIVKKMKLILGDWTIKNALKNKINMAFAIFYMKNVFHWQDKHEGQTTDLVGFMQQLQQLVTIAKTPVLPDSEVVKDLVKQANAKVIDTNELDRGQSPNVG